MNGLAVIEAVIGPDGWVQSQHVIYATTAAMADASLQAVAQDRFSPAKRQGKPVAAIWYFICNFRR